MSQRLGILAAVATALACSQVLPAQNSKSQDRDRLFATAASQYEAGRYAEAVAPLERLVRELPESFEVHELLGLVYAAQLQNAKATKHLLEAVRLKPDSAPARSNLAANYARMGKFDLAEEQFSKAAELEPDHFDTNHNLGEAYVRAGRVAKAIPFLDKAQRINPASYDNGYDLSLAYLVTGRLEEARNSVQNLLKEKDTAELHNLLGQIEEKNGNFIAAVNEFETAAHMEPSEGNIFDWASELLVHRTLEPAIEVFRQGTERHPDSSRMAIGLGLAYYSVGKYDDAVQSLLRAADLNPSDPRAYPFLSRAFDSSPSHAKEVIERFRHFTELRPEDGRAFYYYAISLWKSKRAEEANVDVGQFESLLKKSIALEPRLAEAHLQLANLYSDQKKYAASIAEYLRARELNADLADAHYRLAQAYVRVGEKERAEEEFNVYRKLREQHLSDLDQQRAEIRQFVNSAKEGSGNKP